MEFNKKRHCNSEEDFREWGEKRGYWVGKLITKPQITGYGGINAYMKDGTIMANFKPNKGIINYNDYVAPNRTIQPPK